MDGLILAAGYGTRLRPVTEYVPKCLIRVGGQAMIERWIKSLEDLGCNQININAHYKSEMVIDYLENIRVKSNAKITVHVENELLGTCGAVRKYLGSRDNISEESVIVHADNYMTGGLKDLMSFHKQRRSDLVGTILAFRSEHPRQCGIIEKDSDEVLSGFYEKVQDPPGNLANGAIMIVDGRFIRKANEIKGEDLSKDLLHLMTGKLQVFEYCDTFIDIGSPISLKKARQHSKKFN